MKNIITPAREKRHAPALLSIILLILLILWSAFIFVMSSYNAVKSAKKSAAAIEFVACSTNPEFKKLSSAEKKAYIAGFQFLVRKWAHFCAYAVLSALATGFTISLRKNPVWGFLYCLVFAVSDELHQYFVTGRSCELRDFLIDASGALLGLIIIISVCAATRAVYARISRKD